jgi:hypothetical protein
LFHHDPNWLREGAAYIERWRAIHKAEDEVRSAAKRLRPKGDPTRHWPGTSPRATWRARSHSAFKGEPWAFHDRMSAQPSRGCAQAPLRWISPLV